MKKKSSDGIEKMSKKFYGSILFLWLLVAVYSQVDNAFAESHFSSAEEVVRGESLLETVRDLASEEMEGRASGTSGGDKAASYIAEEFRKVGLEPLVKGDYFQPFEIAKGVKLGADNRLVLELSGDRKVFEAGSSFNPFGFSDEGSLSGEIVFAGYGITAPELQYDDYEGIEVKDKIVLVMTHEPQEKEAEGPFRKPEAFKYTEVRYKVWNAREHGAGGIILMTDPNNHKDEKEELFAIRGTGSASSGIFALNVLREVADAFLSPAGKSLSDLQKEIDEALKPISFPVQGVRAHLQVSLIREKGKAANVIGVLPGRDPTLKEEAIVIGAHYDGLGRGGETSLAPDRYGEVHHGADDNASGVAGILSLAKAFAWSGTKRTLIFTAFAGEEIGLLGSSYYVKNPLWPVEKTYAMINLDSVGRLENGNLYVLGVDTAQEFRPLMEEVNEDFRLKLHFSGDGFGPSDHASFSAQERPVLMVFTGPHADYHRPSDTADKVSAEGLEKVVKFVFRTAAWLADRPDPLHFVKTKGEAPRRERRGGGGYGAYFGSIPDFSESSVPGVRIVGVRPGSPAEKIGLQSGDILTGLGGTAIRNLSDLLYALRSKRAGDQVEVIYLREGQTITAEATLGQRR
jgi:hypothetical protein